ncbi:MAG: hypothetical protein LBE12_11400 [Planctomycetaceae bacterium]|nr:hypothetical protein [Planctomycetaceae bacterium]
MPQADYYPNGNNSACGTLHSYTLTSYQLVGFSLPSVNRVKSAIADVIFCRYIACLGIIHLNNRPQNAKITLNF